MFIIYTQIVSFSRLLLAVALGGVLPNQRPRFRARYPQVCSILSHLKNEIFIHIFYSRFTPEQFEAVAAIY